MIDERGGEFSFLPSLSSPPFPVLFSFPGAFWEMVLAPPSTGALLYYCSPALALAYSSGHSRGM